jgi:hypothetical protein
LFNARVSEAVHEGQLSGLAARRRYSKADIHLVLEKSKDTSRRRSANKRRAAMGGAGHSQLDTLQLTIWASP